MTFQQRVESWKQSQKVKLEETYWQGLAKWLARLPGPSLCAK